LLFLFRAWLTQFATRRLRKIGITQWYLSVPFSEQRAENCTAGSDAENNTSVSMNYEPCRRRYPRYEFDTKLSVTASGGEMRGVRSGRSLNLSQAGMGGVFVAGWDIGTSVNLEFAVPVSTTPFSVGAVIRSHTSYRYGFEFVALSLSQQEILAKTCRTLALLE
jgi:hypothetical protein